MSKYFMYFNVLNILLPSLIIRCFVVLLYIQVTFVDL